jgi:hypothetical protein
MTTCEKIKIYIDPNCGCVVEEIANYKCNCENQTFIEELSQYNMIELEYNGCVRGFESNYETGFKIAEISFALCRLIWLRQEMDLNDDMWKDANGSLRFLVADLKNRPRICAWIDQ